MFEQIKQSLTWSDNDGTFCEESVTFLKCVLKYRPETTGVDFVGVSLPLNCISKDYIVSESTINQMISYEQHLEKV